METCSVSSLVGTTIIAVIGVNLLESREAAYIFFNIGRRYVNVFPEPVAACSVHDRPEHMLGIAAAWIGEGDCSIPKEEIAVDIGGENLTPEKVTIPPLEVKVERQKTEVHGHKNKYANRYTIVVVDKGE